MLDLPAIRWRFASRSQAAPEPVAGAVRQAAVAVVLREGADGAEMLFIKRADRRGDPWSGHMAFPGGHRAPQDALLRDAAVRETEEEIGLDIAAAKVLGELPRQRPMSVRRQMAVSPFVFEIAGDPQFTLNHEVAAAVWTPLGPMYRGDNAERSSPPFHVDSPRRKGSVFNGFRLADARYFVWGMTYRMVQTFFEAIDPSYRRLPE